MDKLCLTPGAATGAGAVTTFYAYDSGAARSQALVDLASALAQRRQEGTPVLMIDWDLESPNLHHLAGSAAQRPGLLEFIEACRDQLAALASSGLPTDALARRVLAAVDWRSYVEQIDAGRPLYLMRAGRLDDSFGERAARLDWHALFQACPALLRTWRGELAQVFRHVFIDARGGRSAAVSVCTSLLPDRIVGLFTPAQRSLNGLCGVVRRAIAYRCSHEDEQRPLLLYPLPCAPAGLDSAAWRRGTSAGYQPVLEALMATSYGRQQLSLETYFDAVQPQRDTTGDLRLAPAGASQRHPLLDWLEEGDFPWQPPVALTLLRSARAGADSAREPAAPLRLRHAQFPALRALAMHDVRHGWHAAPSLRPCADAVERQLDQLQRLVDQQALHEARLVADRLRHLVLRPAVAQALRRRGAALIKLVYRHDNDTDALLAFTQDELASLEQVLNEAVAGRPLAFS